MKDENNIYSYHTFMFPFRFDKILEKFTDKHEYYKNRTFDERVRKAINDDFKQSLEKDDWEYQKFEVKNSFDYNEVVYFYDFVKDSLFNTKDFEDNATSYYFEKKLQKDAKYIIKVLNQKLYELDLVGINLRIFDTGVGILSFEIENHKYQDLEDILNINEYGRRIYPQFLGENFNVGSTKEVFLPEYIEVAGIKEDFEKEYSLKLEIQLANFILEILGETFTTKKDKRGKYYIQPILDDRMFVISHILNDEYSNKLKNENSLPDFWYEYVFIDKYKGKTVQNQSMQEELIEKSTYKRWQGEGTLYGISRYSFVIMTNSQYFGKEIILNHTKTMYFQMVTLTLVNRASILRFSDEITAISDIEPDSNTADNITNLYKNYLRFKNKLYFKEITPQEQGIELYDKMREIMRIDSDIGDLSIEIGTLNSYAFVLQEKDEKEEMAKLSKLGTIFLPGTFIAGVLGMNVFGDRIEGGGWIVLSFTIIGCLTYYITKVHNIEIKSFFIPKKRKKDE